MNNVVDQLKFKTIQAELEVKLQAILDKNGDEFLPGEECMNAWGYHWDDADSIKLN